MTTGRDARAVRLHDQGVDGGQALPLEVPEHQVGLVRARHDEATVDSDVHSHHVVRMRLRDYNDILFSLLLSLPRDSKIRFRKLETGVISCTDNCKQVK